VIFDPQIGVLNYLLHFVSLPKVGWVTDNNVALWSVAAVTAWTVYPFVVLVTLAALQSVQADLYDGAAVDGASAWQMLRYVVIPAILPTLAIVALFVVIWSFQLFQVTWVLTEGGPINATNFLIINLYKVAFIDQNLGPAAAIGVVGLLFSSCATVAFFVLQRRRDLEGHANG
jgi:multiple sugar transport system permease protein